MAKKITLLGAGGHAKVVLDCLGGKAHNFIDDKTEEFFGLKKLKKCEGPVIISFGGVDVEGLQKRQKVFDKHKKKSYEFVNAIHPTAIISENSEIGEGVMIGAGAIINAGAIIGNNVIINTGAIIEHDALIEDGAHIAPGAVVLGGAKIGKTAMVGAGAVILPSAEVPENAMVKSLTRFPR